MTENLLKLFNICYDSRCIPSIWRQGIIKPIPKGVAKYPFLPLNYRGITLVSCVYKIFSYLINTRVLIFWEQNELLVDEQNGFRSGRSCSDHLFSITSIVRKRLETGSSTFCAFIDLQKAFDRIDRNLLLYKVNNIGIRGKLFNIIRGIYSHSSASVQIASNINTPWFHTPIGVRQGDVMSPTMFAIYINDLIHGLKTVKNCGIDINGEKICAFLYADDLVLVSNDEESLQSMLNTMQKWCSKWRLLINDSKSNVIHFRKARSKRSEHRFTFGKVNLEYVNCYKYLGLPLYENMDFQKTAKMLADSACRAMGALISKFKSCKFMKYKTYTKLFNTLVCPITDYCAGIWGLGEFDKINHVLVQGIRAFLGAHRHIASLLSDMGWPLDTTRRKVEILRYWNRIHHLSDNRLTKKIFNWLYNGNSAWCRDACEVLTECEMLDVYRNKLM